MNSQSLIPVFNHPTSNQSILMCDARDLHAFLKVGKRFASWITERISEYNFIDNQDYIGFSQNREKPKGGRPTTEYHLTMDMAKELAMVERNEQGRIARKYFIECEKRLQREQLKARTESSLIVQTIDGEPHLKRFMEGDFMVDVVEIKGEPWFVAKTVCNSIDICNSSSALEYSGGDNRRLESISRATPTLPTGRFGQSGIKRVLINYQGILELVNHSIKPKTVPFLQWIRKEVMPHYAFSIQRALISVAKPAVAPTSLPDERLFWRNHEYAVAPVSIIKDRTYDPKFIVFVPFNRLETGEYKVLVTSEGDVRRVH